MYAVVQTGGKQYKVKRGDVLRFEKLPGNAGDSVVFNDVLMVVEGDRVDVGHPILDNASVHGQIVEQDRAKKILVFKYKRRKRYRRKRGHRQYFTAVRIEDINTGETSVSPSEAADTTPDDVETPITDTDTPAEDSTEEPGEA